MYDVIVIGTGGVGSAAMYHLACGGLRVLGLDRFPAGHDKGSSHGESRIIRRSYFEHPNYVPLLNSAYELWDELQATTGQRQIHRTGLLYSGVHDGAVIQGVLQSARQHSLRVEQLTPAEAALRFPEFTLPLDQAILYEPDAGYLLVEECVRTHIREAVRLNAEHKFGETVLNWTASESHVVVETDLGRYEADRLIITAGPWAKDVLSSLQIPLTIVKKYMHWFETNDSRYSDPTSPCFFIEAFDGYFYGFPHHGPTGMKVAEHSGRIEVTNPLIESREPSDMDSRRVASFIEQHLPGVTTKRTRHDVCFYTMTPDEHFIIDRHPEYDSVVFAAGLSGHGFKFASVLGQRLAQMTIATNPPTPDVEFLSLQRPTLWKT